MLRFVRVVDLSMSPHGGRDELSMPTQLLCLTACVAVVSDAYRCLRRCRPHVSIDNVMQMFSLAKPVIPVQRQGLVMSLAVGIQGQKAYGLCKTPYVLN